MPVAQVKKAKKYYEKTNQHVLVSTNSNTVSLSSSTITFSFEEQVLRAEKLHAVDRVCSNYSFASAKNDNKKFKAMFPDSKIAESYTQGKIKTKYVTEYGIAPYFIKGMLNDFLNQPFSVRFDESTTNQNKKQYDSYVQFWSPNIRQIVNKYCGSVGHCTSEQLFDQFLDFSKEMGWDTDFLMHLGMDGPSVNLKFQEDLKKDFEETTGEKFLDVDTLTLSKVYTSFKKEVSVLPIDIDQFIVDLHES